MAQVIVNATHKGGEGKTTITINLAEFFTIIKQLKVLVVDFDPQANLSSRYIEMEYDPASPADSEGIVARPGAPPTRQPHLVLSRTVLEGPSP